MELISYGLYENVKVGEVKFNLECTTGLNDIQSLRLYFSGDKELSTRFQFGKDQLPSPEVIFKDYHYFSDTTYLWLSIQLHDNADLLNKVSVFCSSIRTNSGIIKPELSDSSKDLRLGIALRQHMDDGVHTFRIPGLTTTNKGTLLTIYDVRRESSRDLQGDIDIGLSRSIDGGNSWEPMRIVLDMNEYGDLPEKFNGVSDACILVDKNSNTIFVAGLWMHGVLDENGRWIKDLNGKSDAWEHQWKRKGSQPGFGIQETSQFLVTKSTDDGQTWSTPVNLTRMCKKSEWWLLAPAPGHGITLDDGTLVFPTQGRDENGNSFSCITWSKDRGETWKTSNPAYFNTTECMAVQLSDGSLMLNMRHNDNRSDTTETNGRAVAVTSDLGNTWAEHPTSKGALIEPTCMASLHKHEYSENEQKKSILMFSNPNSKTGRNHMTIKVSFDDGQTWPEKNWLLLDELKSRGYSCLTSIDENTIGILYEGSQADLVFQKIPVHEIRLSPLQKIELTIFNGFTPQSPSCLYEACFLSY